MQSNPPQGCLEDFNWKFPSRGDTMYLSKFQDKRPRSHIKNERNPLNIDDIDGAKPRYLLKKQLNKPCFINHNDDIDKSRPKITKITEGRPDRQLMTADIQGTSPHMNKFVTKRQTNPLQPHYQLPYCQKVEPQIPRFIRDSINVYDIEGTTTKQTFPMRLQRQNKIIEKPEIVTKTTKKMYIRTQNFMDPKDINDTGKFQSQRVTNPQQPIYQVMNQHDQKIQIGPIEKNKTKQQPQVNRPDFSHRHGDIEGSWPGTLAARKAPQKVTITNYVADIKGTNVGSKKNGIVSNRIVNPIQPIYNYPGNSEPPVIAPTIHSRPKSAAQKLDSFIR